MIFLIQQDKKLWGKGGSLELIDRREGDPSPDLIVQDFGEMRTKAHTLQNTSTAWRRESKGLKPAKLQVLRLR